MNRTALIVEDDPRLTATLRDLLDAAGLHVITARDATEATPWLGEADAVVIDRDLSRGDAPLLLEATAERKIGVVTVAAGLQQADTPYKNVFAELTWPVDGDRFVDLVLGAIEYGEVLMRGPSSGRQKITS